MHNNLNVDDIRLKLEERLIKKAEESDRAGSSRYGHSFRSARDIGIEKYAIEEILTEDFGYTYDEISSVYDRKFTEG